MGPNLEPNGKGAKGQKMITGVVAEGGILVVGVVDIPNPTQWQEVEEAVDSSRLLAPSQEPIPAIAETLRFGGIPIEHRLLDPPIHPMPLPMHPFPLDMVVIQRC